MDLDLIKKSKAFINNTKQKKNLVNWQKIMAGLLVGLLGLAGLGAVGWGCMNLVKMSQVPICIQPVDEKISSESALFKNVGVMTVQIAGAVKLPDIYQVSWDTRLGELIDLSGGLTEKADQELVHQQLNLATALEDGQKIYIPFLKEAEFEKKLNQYCNSGVGSIESEIDEEIENQGNLISINESSAAQLQALGGIGEKRAADIVQNRPYLKIEDLLTKEVVGEAIFENIKDLICL
ncbi:MAG: helix-hairpin-helix domain-containing protein [Patescibacteria group bacterium]|nr:helix-hairpin-helix domain-containing protein [Patescibacteria group bacterium]